MVSVCTVPARGGRSCERFVGYKTINRITFTLVVVVVVVVVVVEVEVVEVVSLFRLLYRHDMTQVYNGSK